MYAVNGNLLAKPLLFVVFARNGDLYKLAFHFGEISVKSRVAVIGATLVFVPYSFGYIIGNGFYIFFVYHNVHLTQYPICRQAV